jgi:hypothetical protein
MTESPDRTMVERVARAMCVAHGIEPEAASLGKDGHIRRSWESRLGEARAAIQEMREPTEVMLQEGNSLLWQAMIDAALSGSVNG